METRNHHNITGAFVTERLYFVLQSPKGQVQAAVEHAIKCGYRHIDGAWDYGNEEEVGQAVAKMIKEDKVKREHLFITSKARIWRIGWNTSPSN